MQEKGNFLCFSFPFSNSTPSILAQRTLGWRMACRHWLAEVMFVMQGYIQNATLLCWEHRLSTRLPAALCITDLCDPPLAGHGAPSDSAQVQIYPQDSEDFVSLSSPYSGACLPLLHSVALTSPPMLLFPVHLGALYAPRCEALLHVGQVMQQPLFAWRNWRKESWSELWVLQELGADFHFQFPSVSSSFVPNYLHSVMWR